MAKYLVIIEGPGKIKKYAALLGRDYKILATKGHCIDLPSKGINVKIKKDKQGIYEFTPNYQIMDDKKEIVSDLVDEAKKHQITYLMTDPDRSIFRIIKEIIGKRYNFFLCSVIGRNVMIQENVPITNNHRKAVTRVCDDCGKIETVKMSIVWGGRQRRDNQTDYCKKCAYSHRRLIQEKMERSPSWNGGRYLNENGYWRVYDGSKYIYEHKKIMSEFLGREISAKEKVHHIDMNKQNNSLDNLYLCKNKSVHSSVHAQMEEIGFSLLNNQIWYNWIDKTYSVTANKSKADWPDIDLSDLLKNKVYFEARRIEGKKYARLTSRSKGYAYLHTAIMQELSDKFDKSIHIVHHVDGNSLNNSTDNLDFMTRSQHRNCHNSLQESVAQLLKVNLVSFDKNSGRYEVSL
jgi:hypothetical protein